MRFSFFGAAPDTGNLGVTALCYAMVINILKFLPDAEITVFDYGKGRSRLQVPSCPHGAKLYRQGAVYGRNFFQPENIRIWKLLSTLGGIGNSGVRTLRESDAVLDISGGDSFADIYGPRRFQGVTYRKLLALKFNIPLILLPQTYGPFNNIASKRIVSQIGKKACSVWARDKQSFEVLRDLLGECFDEKRHRCGVDVAFGLPSAKPVGLPATLESFLKKGNKAIIGLNVSGLIYNDSVKARQQFGFKADYKSVVAELVQRFLKETDCKIILVPHVVTPKGHYESDLDACKDVADYIDPQNSSRLMICPVYDNPCEVKWIIQQCDWFCGTRMHATIAALSSAVPVSAISYSPKTLGVFETCGQGEHVADPKTMSGREVVEWVWASWCNRQSALRKYEDNLPSVKKMVDEQIQSIINAVQQQPS